MNKRIRKNPATLSKSVVSGMKKLAKETNGEFEQTSAWVEVSTGFEREYYIVMTAWRSPSRTREPIYVGVYLANQPSQNRLRQLWFRTFEDARDAYLHFYNILFATEGYLKRRLKELAAQEHPKLPGGRTR